ncbi:hypothetical protein [Cytobacillus sp. IB215665]|uniref:hypothetical protein n=1 Tax=Cytobacillus sp. IB215665 TaxID=3097357 RepID=UPI002A0B59A3|nr:hypothetical protein [Cytobacillus sp. IB215665]MDX8365444.1 hypothetical protein [Cytobacillus sp. IB215665]
MKDIFDLDIQINSSGSTSLAASGSCDGGICISFAETCGGTETLTCPTSDCVTDNCASDDCTTKFSICGCGSTRIC